MATKKRTWHSVPGALLLSALLCLPIITLIWLSLNGSLESFSHVARNVIPNAGRTTLFLMIGVGLVTALIGTVTAWLITFFHFPLRNTLQWALMLPLAVPTYISAYAFVEFFSFTGPIQETVRYWGGFHSSREYWFPEIRSLWGTVLVFSLVLYPYVYLSVRTLFALQGSNMTDSARALGANPSRVFFSITLPLARPGIILGVTLALMETINDIGAVDYLGINTLTHSVFAVWLNQSDLAGAAQIALFLLVIVFGLIYLEYASRGSRQYAEQRKTKANPPPRICLKGNKAMTALLVCLSPVMLGFTIPLYVLGEFALKDFGELFTGAIIEALITTISLGALAAFLTVSIGLALSLSLRHERGFVKDNAIRLASIGYAVPGTLIALGVFIPLAYFDNALDAFMRSQIGVSTGLLVTGSGAALVFAYTIRFMAMAKGSLQNGLEKLSPNLDMAARCLGQNKYQVLSRVLVPLLLPAISSAALLVFVDVVKELSATILLRPFGMNTLATHVYDYASQGRVEDGAFACILIIAVGMIPVILLSEKKKNF